MVLVPKFEVPYCRISKIFKHIDNSDNVQNWVLVQTFDWANPSSPLDSTTCSPFIKAKDQNIYQLLRISEIDYLVQDISEPYSNDRNYWINWWINFGESKYPTEHIDKMISLYWK